MKKLSLLSLFVLALFSARSQNGGQNGENESVKVSLGPITSDWKQVIIVKNKQTCPAEIKFEHNDRTVVKSFSALGTDTFLINLPNCTLRVKPLDNCGGANMGWLEYNVCTALPIKFEYLRVTKVSTNEFEIEFKVQNSHGDDRFNVQVSSDGLHYKTVTVILAKPVQPNQIYKTKITL